MKEERGEQEAENRDMKTKLVHSSHNALLNYEFKTNYTDGQQKIHTVS